MKGRETVTLLGPLEKPNLNQFTGLKLAYAKETNRVSPTALLRTKTDSVSETLCSVEYRR